eukprot:CAMPEP_0183297178 /NCGR_PEP_ID=MMETSP0160_2-20130417/4537_1 /TAXON_ID=2839 ORGANISM="Odontella Sinensis, Strain Grunow 1884" /NCGR_SAMPLE_ID=MMETSP0160_2 /ASSEMBLY_ACC=CAM_ASM_000250 /LENGTH=396 /DNA_ID=CAMNT_0025458941 /DNA_START=61 /DNA_END=1251 /DNA_ORIENTATION=-
MRTTTLALLSVLATAGIICPSSAFVFPSPACRVANAVFAPVTGAPVVRTHGALKSTADANSESDAPTNAESYEDIAPAVSGVASELAEEDWLVVRHLLDGFPESVPLEDRVASALQGMHPRLVLALRSAADSGDDVVEDDVEKSQMLRKVGLAMSSLLDGRLSGGRDLLASLLAAGEIRKLDGLIGRACKDGKLDMAFFTVLNMNIRDAAYEAGRMSPQERAKLEAAKVDVPTNEDSGNTDRLQILQHIYTRCQEEVEKTVDPGAGLLNKLLRTDAPGIRRNQLGHYLGPQPNVVKTPDGKEIPLEGNGPALVPLKAFVDAIGNSVLQIRTVEKAGGASRETAAGLVESIRQVAIEARVAIAEAYGTDSQELRNFELGLQPIFRPENAESEYIKGE